MGGFFLGGGGGGGKGYVGPLSNYWGGGAPPPPQIHHTPPLPTPMYHDGDFMRIIRIVPSDPTGEGKNRSVIVLNSLWFPILVT